MMERAPDPTNRVDWCALIPEEEWQSHQAVIDEAHARNVRFALGGGCAFSEYSRRMRNTKDLDFFVLPEQRELMIESVRAAGYQDLYEKEPYDRSWIFRGHRNGFIADVIWTMPNHRMVVDERWLTHGESVVIRGYRLQLLPIEELIWSKIYVLQHDRCDWPDVWNILRESGNEIDWNHLLGRVQEDMAVMAGLMSVYRWLCPERAKELPGWIWKELGIELEVGDGRCEPESQRVFLLDTRDWFGPKELAG